MTETTDLDIETPYPLADFVAELRRLADALEAGEAFEIEIDGETVAVPEGASLSVEHEIEDGEAEIEFQIKWTVADEDDEEEDEEDEAEEAEEE